MSKSRLQEYLSAFNKKDWRCFKKYSSEKINDGTDLHLLLQYIFKNKKFLSQDLLNIETVHEKLFLNKSRKSVLNLYSDITDLAKNYIIHDQLEQEKYVKKMLLLKGLNQRKLYHQAYKIVEGIEQDGMNNYDWWTPLYKLQLYYHHYYSPNPFGKSKFSHKYLEAIQSNLNQFAHEITALNFFDKHNNIQLNKSHYNNSPIAFNFDQSTNSKVVPILEKLYKVRVEQDQHSVQELEDFFARNHYHIADVFRHIIFLVLKMNIAREINQGNMGASKRLMLLYRTMVDNDYLKYSEQISAKLFINISECACFLNESQWGSQFIDSYQEYLQPDERTNIIKIAEAYIAFSDKNYDLTIKKLSTIYSNSIFIKSVVNRLQLITYIENDPEDEQFLLSRIENYRLYLYRNRNKVSSKTYNGSINLTKILKAIIQNEKTAVIRSRVKKTPVLFYRHYLYNKLQT